MRSTSAATALAVLFSSAALSVVAAGPASAQEAVVDTPVGIVADGALQRVFVADRDNGRILATDYSGTLRGLNVGFGEIRDLEVSGDGATLYAALPASHEIVALDAATLQVRTRYDIGVGVDPRELAFAGGRLWFSYKIMGDDDAFHGNLGSIDPAIDPAGEADAVSLGRLPEGISPYGNSAFIDADLSAPGLLAYADSGGTGMASVLDVSGTTPQVVARSSENGYFGEVDLMPGAAQVLFNGDRRFSYASGVLTEAGAYPGTVGYADVSQDGLVARYSSQVSVYKPGSDEPVRTFDPEPYGMGPVTWAPDSSRLFAMMGSTGGRYTLKAFTDPALSVPTLTVNAPAKATRTKPLTVTGKLSATVPFPAGTKLGVTRTDLDSPSGHALPSVTVKADGTYSFTNSPPAGATVTYKVSYAGDAEHAPAAASDKVDVSRTTPALTLNNNKKTYDYGKDVSFTAHLGATYKNRTVEIWVDPYGTDRPNKLVRTGKVNAAGNISTTVDMTRDMVVTAVFRGDARYSSRVVRSTAYGRARVSTAVSKHYKTGRIGSQSYYWFHKNTDPVLTTTMNYYPGRKQRFDLQVFYQGTWYSSDSEYFGVATNGRSAVQLVAPGESGIRARVRSAYIDGASGDNVNSTAYGSWKYLYFSN